MIKITIEGTVQKVFPIKTVKNGYTQAVRLYQPEEEYRGRKIVEEFFTISTFTNSSTDSRILKPEQEGTRIKASVYLKGERWPSGNRGDYEYNHALKLLEWQH
jgi:hypothetical protein